MRSKSLVLGHSAYGSKPNPRPPLLLESQVTRFPERLSGVARKPPGPHLSRASPKETIRTRGSWSGDSDDGKPCPPTPGPALSPWPGGCRAEGQLETSPNRQS